MSVVSSELSVRTRAAISQTTGSKLKKKKQNIIELVKKSVCVCVYKRITLTH